MDSCFCNTYRMWFPFSLGQGSQHQLFPKRIWHVSPGQFLTLLQSILNELSQVQTRRFWARCILHKVSSLQGRVSTCICGCSEELFIVSVFWKCSLIYAVMSTTESYLFSCQPSNMFPAYRDFVRFSESFSYIMYCRQSNLRCTLSMSIVISHVIFCHTVYCCCCCSW